MPKTVATAQQIQAEIHRRIRSSTDLDEDCRECEVSLPRPADPKHFDGNWTVDFITRSVPGCEALVMAIARQDLDELAGVL